MQDARHLVAHKRKKAKAPGGRGQDHQEPRAAGEEALPRHQLLLRDGLRRGDAYPRRSRPQEAVRGPHQPPGRGDRRRADERGRRSPSLERVRVAGRPRLAGQVPGVAGRLRVQLLNNLPPTTSRSLAHLGGRLRVLKRFFI